MYIIISRFDIFFNILENMSTKYYAVARGRTSGIYNTWLECKQQVDQFPRPIFRKFHSIEEAEDFIKQYTKINKKENNKNLSFILGKRLQNNQESNNKKSLKKRKQISLEEHSKIIHIENKEISGDFNIDNDGYVNVYTDGACSLNGCKNAQAGIGVWFGDNHPLNISKAVVGRATNNMAEIQAVTVAAKQAKKAGIKNLKINTDSQFLISCINNWMPKWKRNGWKTFNNKPVINKIELLEMENALKFLNVIWNHVNGHAGIYGNEMADKLARAGCSKY
ncbi:ribonuclease H1 [Apis laboriosa]|uniref:ribonuclease H1 n=1 Tax=Apis laboriosa TaxID=183418 RepID=UPI001CC3E075|nr:ribonuclease H1 [Apis laboriosa]